MLRTIQRALLRRGWWIHRVQPFERAVAEMYYDRGGFTFVQIGANDGVSFDNLYHLVQRFNGRGVVVEPLENCYRRLKENYRWLPQVSAVRCAVHPTQTSITLYRVRENAMAEAPSWATGIASCDPDWLTKHGIAEGDIESESVPASHLMDVIRRHGLEGVDVLQVDTEGFDHEVIRMIDFDVTRPKLIKYEYSKTTANGELEREDDMASWLRQRGYAVSMDGCNVVAELRDA
jgi:FkbM family methyltransferase